MPIRRIVLTKSFEKAYKKFTRNNLPIRTAIDRSIRLLELVRRDAASVSK